MLSDCAFRAQLALPEQRALFDYWQDIAPGRTLPARADFDPLKVPHLLPQLGLIDLRDGLDRAHFRLAGTGLRDIYGREITDLRLTEVFSAAPASPWHRIHADVATKGLCAQGAMRGPAKGRDHIVLFWLRLPLSDDGVRVDRILCHEVGEPAVEAEPVSDFTAYCSGLQELAADRAAPLGRCG